MEWPCPMDLEVGDEVEFRDTATNKVTAFKIQEKEPDYAWGYRVHSEDMNGFQYSFCLHPDTRRYGEWRRTSRPTIPNLEIAPCYGVKCGQCDTWCEHAEAKPGFVCYGCRSFG